jgi:hypothetical protein
MTEVPRDVVPANDGDDVVAVVGSGERATPAGRWYRCAGCRRERHCNRSQTLAAAGEDAAVATGLKYHESNVYLVVVMTHNSFRNRERVSHARGGDDMAWSTWRTKSRGCIDVGRREGDEEVGSNQQMKMGAEGPVHKRVPSENEARKRACSTSM